MPRPPPSSRPWQPRARPASPALARLQGGRGQARRRRTQAGALAALDGLAAGGGGDPILRDLGTLLAVEQQLDTGDPATLTQQLEPLAAAGAPWRNQARELLALVAIRAGELDEAREHPGRAEQRGRRAALAAAARRRAAAGDRGRARPRRAHERDLSRRGALTAAAALPRRLRRGHLAGRDPGPAAARRAQAGAADRGPAAAPTRAWPSSTSPCRRRCAMPTGRRPAASPTHAMQHLEAADTIEVAWRVGHRRRCRRRLAAAGRAGGGRRPGVRGRRRRHDHGGRRRDRRRGLAVLPRGRRGGRPPRRRCRRL